MAFHIDAIESSDDYFSDQRVNEIPAEGQDPLYILLEAEQEYIRIGEEHVLHSKRIGEEFELDA